ncbi:MAG: hypothetical protein ACE14P_13810, partial [Methanotrichaceae archaeon]
VNLDAVNLDAVNLDAINLDAGQQFTIISGTAARLIDCSIMEECESYFNLNLEGATYLNRRRMGVGQTSFRLSIVLLMPALRSSLSGYTSSTANFDNKVNILV